MVQTSPRFLLAEDDPAMRELVRDTLRPLAGVIDEAATGFDLITCLAEHGPYDLVVTDVRMPWMTGIQGVIAARHAGLTVPFIVMTAFGNVDLQRLVESMGRAVLLSKPFELAALREAAVTSLRAG